MSHPNEGAAVTPQVHGQLTDACGRTVTVRASGAAPGAATIVCRDASGREHAPVLTETGVDDLIELLRPLGFEAKGRGRAQQVNRDAAEPLDGLTARQQSILAFIAQHIHRLGYPPTVRDIGRAFGISSTNGVADHLKALERKGAITRDRLKSRGIRVVARG